MMNFIVEYSNGFLHWYHAGDSAVLHKPIYMQSGDIIIRPNIIKYDIEHNNAAD